MKAKAQKASDDFKIFWSVLVLVCKAVAGFTLTTFDYTSKIGSTEVPIMLLIGSILIADVVCEVALLYTRRSQ